jgi:hypothetical protein
MAKTTNALIALAMLCTLVPESRASDQPMTRQQESIVQFHTEAKQRSRAEAIQEKQYAECTTELRNLIDKINAEAAAKGQPPGKVKFGTNPNEVNLYLGWKAVELQKKCEAIKNKPAETEKLLPKVESIIAE